MRAAAAIGLLGLLAGCNSIYGLDETHKAPPDAPTPGHVQLDYQLLGSPGDTPQFVRIANLDHVNVGPLGQNLQPATIDATSIFEFPFEFENLPCRVVFTLPTELTPREVLWTCIDNAHYTIPIFGRIERTFAPGNASITFPTTANNPPGFAQPRMFTTGLYTQAVLGNQGNPVVNVYSSTVSAAKTAPMGGPLGVLDSTQDAVWLVDYITQTGPDLTTVAGFARGTVDLVAGPSTSTVTPTPSWMTPPPPGMSQFTVGGSNDTDDRSRITSALGGRAFQTLTAYAGGVTPSLAMPASTKLDDDARPDDGVFFPLVIVPSLGNGVPATRNPFVGSDELSLAVRYRLTNNRMALGSVSVTSGFQAFYPPTAGVQLTHETMGIARDISIRDLAETAAAVDLNGDDTSTPAIDVGFAGTMPLELRFRIDAAADTCEVTVFKLDGIALTQTRSIDMFGVVSNVPLTVDIDPSAFAMDQDYIVRITCRLGYLPAAIAANRNDAVMYPFFTSTNYAAAFHTKPM